MPRVNCRQGKASTLASWAKLSTQFCTTDDAVRRNVLVREKIHPIPPRAASNWNYSAHSDLKEADQLSYKNHQLHVQVFILHFWFWTKTKKQLTLAGFVSTAFSGGGSSFFLTGSVSSLLAASCTATSAKSAKQTSHSLGEEEREMDRVCACVCVCVCERVRARGILVREQVLLVASSAKCCQHIQSNARPWHATLPQPQLSLQIVQAVSYFVSWHGLPSNAAAERPQQSTALKRKQTKREQRDHNQHTVTPQSSYTKRFTVIAEIFVRVKISYSSVCQLSYARNFRIATLVSDTHAYVYGFRMLLNFVLSAKSTKYTKLNRVRKFVRLQWLPQSQKLSYT